MSPRPTVQAHSTARNAASRGVGIALLVWAPLASAQEAGHSVDLAARLARSAFSSMVAGPVAPPWRLVGLPGQKAPFTRFDIQPLPEGAALRVRADGSYGNLLFDADTTLLAATARLRWRWRLERGLELSDLQHKAGDDAPVKVCALFDMALDGLSFGEQARLRMARAVSGETLPAATLCYVWDRLLPTGSIISNAFSARVRYLVVSDGPPRPGHWVSLDRPLTEDFQRAFGHETRTVPALVALAVGADADNTGGSSMALVGDVQLVQP